MRQSGLLLDDNRDVSEACVARPLVEIDVHSERLNITRMLQVLIDYVYSLITDNRV